MHALSRTRRPGWFRAAALVPWTRCRSHDQRDAPVGAPPRATPLDDGAVEFRVWALAPTPFARVGDEEHAPTDVGGGVDEGRVDADGGEDYVFMLQRRGESVAPAGPASRHQPGGLRGPSRSSTPRRSGGTTPTSNPSPRRARHLRAARRHVHARGTSRPRSSISPRSPSWASRRSRSCRCRVSRAHGWGYDGVYLRGALDLRGPPASAPRRRRPRRGLSVILDVVYTTSARGERGARRLGPYFTIATDVLG